MKVTIHSSRKLQQTKLSIVCIYIFSYLYVHIVLPFFLMLEAQQQIIKSYKIGGHNAVDDDCSDHIQSEHTICQCVGPSY